MIYSIKENDNIINESLTTKIVRRDNENDYSPFGYKVDFYDGNDHIGEGSICGIKDNNGFLYDFEVFPKFRGKGYSKEMLQFFINKYHAKSLFVNHDNTIAINLYKKFGFKVTKKFKLDGKLTYQMDRATDTSTNKKENIFKPKSESTIFDDAEMI
jgi:ribosomal protein S18 acetylase RimI-like enzyme